MYPRDLLLNYANDTPLKMSHIKIRERNTKEKKQISSAILSFRPDFSNSGHLALGPLRLKRLMIAFFLV